MRFSAVIKLSSISHLQINDLSMHGYIFRMMIQGKTIKITCPSFLFLIYMIVGHACVTKKKSNDAVDSARALTNNDTTQNVIVRNHTSEISHASHIEDEKYPWWDEPKVGTWIQEDYLKTLISIHRGEINSSLYDYVKRINPCQNKLLDIQIEGCAKEKALYLKHLDCGDKFIGKAEGALDSENDTIIFMGNSTDKNYVVIYGADNDLVINGEHYKRNVGQLAINDAIVGRYLLFYNSSTIPDSIYFKGSSISGSGSINSMYLHQLTYIQNPQSNINPPSIKNADLVNVGLMTNEIDEESGEPIIESYQFELVRTPDGFELHNKMDHLTLEVKVGMHYKFVRMKSSKRH